MSSAPSTSSPLTLTTTPSSLHAVSSAKYQSESLPATSRALRSISISASDGDVAVVLAFGSSDDAVVLAFGSFVTVTVSTETDTETETTVSLDTVHPFNYT